MSKDYSKDLTLLGNQEVPYNYEYNPEVLETFDNDFPNRDYFVKFNLHNGKR